MKQPLTVLGVGKVTPYTGGDALPSAPPASLAGHHAGAARPVLDLALLERTLRRGLSDVTRLFMHAAKLALDDAGREAASMHVIFASAFGEIATAEALLAEAYDNNSSSPARFRNSVHNTTTGLLSISTHNRLASSAIAAGWETVPMALFEAAAQLADQAETVLLVFAEERVPSALSDRDPHGPLGAALVLTRTAAPAVRTRGTLVNLRRVPRDPRVAAAAGDPHPLGPALALVEALSAFGSPAPQARAATSEAASRTLTLSDGESPWCVDVHAGEPS